MKTKLSVLALFIAFGTNANQLSNGKNLIPVNSGSTSQTYTISGYGQKTLTMQVPSNLDFDMYVSQTLSNGSTKTLCKPYDYPGNNEVCYLDLEAGTFKMHIKNLSAVSKYVDVTLQDYNCSPSLYQTPFIICPVSGAIEKSSSYNKSWKISYSSSNPSTTHTGVDRYADDINWSSGNNDLNLPLFAPIDGQIIFSGQSLKSDSAGAYGFGKQVIIYNPYSRTAARLAHLNETLSPSSTWVNAGDYIGKMGSTGNSTHSHLHLVLYRDIDSTALNNLTKGIFPNGKTLSEGNDSKYVAPFLFKSDFRMPRINEG